MGYFLKEKRTSTSLTHPHREPSPYLQFRTSFNGDCGDRSNGLIPMQNNFFGLSQDDPAMKNIAEHCETAFRVFDDILLDLINADLLFTEAYSRTLDEMNDARRSADTQKEAKDTTDKKKRSRRSLASESKISSPPNSINQNVTERPARKVRRKRQVLIGMGVVIAATSVHSLISDVGSRNRDKAIIADLEVNRKAISELSQSLELNTEMIEDLAKQLKRSQAPIIVRGGMQVPHNDMMHKNVLDGNPQSTINYFATYAQNYGKEMVRSLLQLTNHRLPLYGTFIDTIRAHCLSVQTIADRLQAQEFCLGYAYHVTRWDTDLRYLGVGITTFDVADNTTTTTPSKLRIKEVVINLRIEIPRLQLKAERYRVVNLGYFQDQATRQRIDIPQFLVKMPSSEVLEMNPSLCLRFTPSFSCSSTSLQANQCGEQLLARNNTRFCNSIPMDPQKCGLYETNDMAFVSMRQKSTVQFFHHAPSIQINKIDSFKKTIFNGALNCGPVILKVTAGIESKTSITKINYIAPVKIRVTNIEEERLRIFESQQSHHQDMINSAIQERTKINSTVQTIYEAGKNEVQHLSDLVHGWAAGLMGWLTGITTLVLIIAVTLIIVKIKASKKKTTNHIILGNYQQPKHESNRADATL
jgi:hypothetical protein